MRTQYAIDISGMNYLLREGKLEDLAQTGTVVRLPSIISDGVDGEYSDLLTEYENKGVVMKEPYSGRDMAKLEEFRWKECGEVEGLGFYDVPPIYTAKKRQCPLLSGDDIFLDKVRGIAGVVACNVKDFCEDLQEQLIDCRHVLVTVATYVAGEESYIQEV